MKKLCDLHFGIYILLLIFAGISKSQQTCAPPDLPAKGNYSSRKKQFLPGDKVTYNCAPSYALMGNEESKCKTNGEWSNPTPFCDRKARLSSSYIIRTTSKRQSNPEVMDNDTNTCSCLNTGETQILNFGKQIVVHAIRLFFQRGIANIKISNWPAECAIYKNYFEKSHWDMITCKSNKLTDSVRIQENSSTSNNLTICEIEVYIKEEDECETPPDRKVVNGYFEVSRSTAELFCEDGYRSNNARLVCERNFWVGNRLQCEEILCSPGKNLTMSPGSEWTVLDAVNKVSAGTRKQLKCSTGYEKIGGPDVVICQKNGTWTKTNVACVKEKKPKVNTKTIIYASLAVVVALIIIILLGTTIYFIRKQHNGQVIVVYKSPNEGNMISESEGDYSSAYYETIQDNTQPASLPVAETLKDGYFIPLSGKDTLKKQPMPADIAFGTLKQSTLYGC